MKEFDLQVMVVDFMIENYPDVKFRSDLGGVRLNAGLAQKVAKLNRGTPTRNPENKRQLIYPLERVAFPDFQVLRPRGRWHALFIELKAKPSGYKYVKGSLRVKDAHVVEQYNYGIGLRKDGYYSDFAGGAGEVFSLLRWYLSGDLSQDYWPYSILPEVD